jgi:hypothetical protein
MRRDGDELGDGTIEERNSARTMGCQRENKGDDGADKEKRKRENAKCRLVFWLVLFTRRPPATRDGPRLCCELVSLNTSELGAL